MRPKGRRNLHSWTKQIPTKGSKTLEKEYVYTWTTTTKKNDEWRIPLWTDAMRDQMLPIPLPSWSQTQAPKFSVSDRHNLPLNQSSPALSGTLWSHFSWVFPCWSMESLALALPKPYLSIPSETQIEHFYSSQKNGTHIKGGWILEKYNMCLWTHIKVTPATG